MTRCPPWRARVHRWIESKRDQSLHELDTDSRQVDVWKRAGGVRGAAYAAIPSLVLVSVNLVGGLVPAMAAALASGVGILVYRIVRREGVAMASLGLLGVVACSALAYLVGSARGYFAYGIWWSLFASVVLTGSVIVRRPLIGEVWAFLTRRGGEWRQNRRVLRLYDLATASWAAIQGTRFVVQHYFYRTDQEGALALSRLLMGWPLAVVVAALTIGAIRQANTLLEQR